MPKLVISIYPESFREHIIFKYFTFLSSYFLLASDAVFSYIECNIRFIIIILMPGNEQNKG
jgi:hypothetical protein